MWVLVYLCVSGIDILYLSIGFWNCSDSAKFFVFNFIIVNSDGHYQNKTAHEYICLFRLISHFN